MSIHLEASQDRHQDILLDLEETKSRIWPSFWFVLESLVSLLSFGISSKLLDSIQVSCPILLRRFFLISISPYLQPIRPSCSTVIALSGTSLVYMEDIGYANSFLDPLIVPLWVSGTWAWAFVKFIFTARSSLTLFITPAIHHHSVFPQLSQIRHCSRNSALF